LVDFLSHFTKGMMNYFLWRKGMNLGRFFTISIMF